MLKFDWNLQKGSITLNWCASINRKMALRRATSAINRSFCATRKRQRNAWVTSSNVPAPDTSSCTFSILQVVHKINYAKNLFEERQSRLRHDEEWRHACSCWIPTLYSHCAVAIPVCLTRLFFIPLFLLEMSRTNARLCIQVVNKYAPDSVLITPDWTCLTDVVRRNTLGL